MGKIDSTTKFVEQLNAAPKADVAAAEAALRRDAELTKPPGSLGILEQLAGWYAAWRGGAQDISDPQIIVFAGNHGVCAQGVSAFPAEVTAQMVANFQAGGAAINQLARVAGAKLDVVVLDLDRPTQDMTAGPAMDEADFVQALQAGWDAVSESADLLVVGEMGIGNTTAAAAIAHALYGGAAQDWVGPGTGLDAAGVSHKADVVARALKANPDAQGNGMIALQALGGRELAAMAGAIARARALRVPVILDGFICTAAAACLARSVPGSLDHCIAGHVSAEPAHHALLQKLGKEPLLNLGMRLGEASGAAVAISILKAALATHVGMATFAEAGVSDS